MASLYPPELASILPAFIGTEVTVPFKHNISVSSTAYNRIYAKFKYLSTGVNIFTIYTTNITIDSNNNGIAIFTLTADQLAKLDLGESYKVQLGYGYDEAPEYYSTIGVIKYTARPIVTLKSVSYSDNQEALTDLTSSVNEVENIKYYAYCNFSNEVTEKINKYEFYLLDDSNTIVDDSGEQIHLLANEPSVGICLESYIPKINISENKEYKLKFTYETTNGLNYSIVAGILFKTGYNSLIPATLVAENSNGINNYSDDGAIHIRLKDKYDSAIANGSFELARSTDEGRWEVLLNFSIHSSKPSEWFYNDYNIEQGISYRYSIREKNKYNIYSNRILSNSVTADYEDAFLYDGDRQLKLKFNPKITSFKTTLLEQKTNTLGNQFPFTYRNGNTSYKEFSISGLISYEINDNELFLPKSYYKMTDKEFIRQYTKYNAVEVENEDTDILTVSEEIRSERLFKLYVLDWLNNGKPKLFKSPTEGNYIVRLSSVALAPQDTLGRMIHTMSCSAYEVDNYDYNGLIKNNILDISDGRLSISGQADLNHNKNTDSILQYVTYEIYEDIMVNDYEGNNILDLVSKKIPVTSISQIEFSDLTPGDKIQIKGSNTENKLLTFVIGATGTLLLNAQDYTITEIVYPSNNSGTGIINVTYYSTTITNSGTISDLYKKTAILEYPGIQMYGNKLEGTELIDMDCNNTYRPSNNCFLSDSKDNILKILHARFRQKDLLQVYYNEDDNQWYDSSLNEVVTNIYPSTLYVEQVTINNTIEYRYHLVKEVVTNNVYEWQIDANNYITDDELFNAYNIYVNASAEPINIQDAYMFELSEEVLDDLNSLIIGPGVVAEFTVRLNHILYDNVTVGNDTLDPSGEYYMSLLTNISTSSSSPTYDTYRIYKEYCKEVAAKLEQYLKE